MKTLALLFGVTVLAFTQPVQAQEFRAMNRIATPGKAPEGAVPVGSVKAVPRETVEQGVRQLMEAWNTGTLEQHLADSFYDKQRLQDVIGTNMPRDAHLTVLGIQGQQTLQQFEKEGETISRVSVTVRTRLEYEDPARGHRAFDGTVEYILNVTESAES